MIRLRLLEANTDFLHRLLLLLLDHRAVLLGGLDRFEVQEEAIGWEVVDDDSEFLEVGAPLAEHQPDSILATMVARQVSYLLQVHGQGLDQFEVLWIERVCGLERALLAFSAEAGEWVVEVEDVLLVVDEESEQLTALLAGAVVVVLCAGFARLLPGLDEAGVFAVLWLNGEDARFRVFDGDDIDHVAELKRKLGEVFEFGKGSPGDDFRCWGTRDGGSDWRSWSTWLDPGKELWD